MAESQPSHSELLDSKGNDPVGALRILDAEANRAAEGLRVVEDYLRFVLDDRHLTELAKQLRHELTAALRPIAGCVRLTARESQADVGATLAVAIGADRIDYASVATASFKRVQQALRALEEYSKLVDAAIGAAIERLRFRSYTLERAAGITVDSQARLANTRLCVLMDAGPTVDAFARLAESLVAAGVQMLQLREKQLDDRQLLARACQLREITRDTSTLFIMNDRADLAALSRADGVHVGQKDLCVKDARTIVGTNSLVGVSTHDIEQARQAVLDGANYIGVGPTFPSQTKSFSAFAGLEFVRTVAAEIALPAFAIGGITRESLGQVQSAGINRIAVSGAVTQAHDPAAAAADLMAAFGSVKP